MNQFQNLFLTALVASPTNPRKTFDPVKLKELATSIAASGVHQAILVRQLPAQRLLDTAHIKPRPEYEIVAGERRYRASVIAKADTIPAIIRELTDEQVLEVQIIENLQRDDLSALEAAEGYQTLMDHSHLTADQVAEKIGKSRTFVYNSLKLLKLSPTAKLAIREQGLTASVAELIARIPNDALQAKALAFAVAPDGDGDKPSYRTFSQWAQRNVMLNLQYANFPIEFANLVSAAGACSTCSKRTRANPDLFTDVKSADMCIDPPCYHLKAQAHKDALAAQVAAIPKASNRNVDEQQGLGLESMLAQDARAQTRTEEATQRDIEMLRNRAAIETSRAQANACYDTLIDFIYNYPADNAPSLLPVELLRRWLQQYIEMWNAEDLAVVLDMAPKGDKVSFAEYELACKLRIGRADDADIYRYMAAIMLRSEVNSNNIETETLLLNTFATAYEIDLEPVRDEAADQLKAETKAKIADINKQIKAKKGETSAPKTTSTPPPAGAAIDTGDASAKKSKPTGASRKVKTTEQEAISGIAAAMQSIEAEPTGAALEGSEAAAGALAINSAVVVLDGKHKGRVGRVVGMLGSNSWSVELYNALGMPFVTILPTKSIELYEESSAA